MRARPAMYLFPSDLLDEGIGEVTRRLQELGCTPALALAYHQARDLVPHPGAKPRLRYRTDGVFFEWPDAGDGSPRPPLQQADERAVVAEFLAAAPDDGVEAWTVFLHSMSIGERHPRLVGRTCFGDPLLSNLCPSQPDVVRYAERLAAAVANLGIDVIAEALSAQTFGHGHHHERVFSPLGDGEQALLGLCFSDACERLGAAAGLDVERLAASSRRHLQRAFATETRIPATLDALADAVGDDVRGYVEAGTSAVTALASRVADVVHARGRRMSYMDLTGAVLGYDDGLASGPDAAEQSWRLRIDPREIAPLVDSYSILGYVRDPERLHRDVASYRARLGAVPLRVILRPGHPDAASSAELRAHIDAAEGAGADQIDFYNYGMYDHAVLDRVKR